MHFKSLRKEFPVATHKDLGLRAGLRESIYDLENGNEEPFLKTTHKLAAGLGFSTSGFLKIIERRIYGIDKENDSSDF